MRWLPLAAGLVLLGGPAAAHDIPSAAFEAFRAGLLIPMTDPRPVVAGVALAMLIALASVLRRALPWVVAGTLAGVILGPWQPAGAVPALLALATVTGASAALWPQAPDLAVGGLGALTGLGLGFGSLEGTVVGEVSVVYAIGIAVGILLIIAVPAAWGQVLLTAVVHPAARIALRVAGSWSAAIALILLAFEVSNASPV